MREVRWAQRVFFFMAGLSFDIPVQNPMSNFLGIVITLLQSLLKGFLGVH